MFSFVLIAGLLTICVSKPTRILFAEKNIDEKQPWPIVDPNYKVTISHREFLSLEFNEDSFNQDFGYFVLKTNADIAWGRLFIKNTEKEFKKHLKIEYLLSSGFEDSKVE